MYVAVYNKIHIYIYIYIYKVIYYFATDIALPHIKNCCSVI